jgi:HAD superfamily hydrolase (TIGR01509 family)
VTLRLLVFDFDGTLVNTTPLIHRGIDATVEVLGLEPEAAERWRALIGLPLSVQLREVLPPDRRTDEEVERAVALYRSGQRRLGLQAEPFPGIDELVAELTARKLPLAIASSKGREALSATLERLGWTDLFDPVVTPEDVAQAKPHPESLQKVLARLKVPPESAAYVGDTKFDMEMAVRSGVTAWGAGWGGHRARLLDAGASKVFATPAELHVALQKPVTVSPTR